MSNLVREQVRLWVVLYLVVYFELFTQDGVRVERRLRHESDVFNSHRTLLALTIPVIVCFR